MIQPKPDLAVCGWCHGSGWDDSRRGLLCGPCQGEGWIIVRRPYLEPSSSRSSVGRIGLSGNLKVSSATAAQGTSEGDAS